MKNKPMIVEGSDLRRVREGLSVTIEEFAMVCKVAVSTVRSWESSRSRPSAKNRRIIAEQLGTDRSRVFPVAKSPHKRKGVSDSVRFEVFKRDSFKCQYCGSGAPEVLLAVDHIHPVSKGGENEIINLITSCQDCNSGKSDRELDDDSVIVKQRLQLEELNARREQLEMMLRWREGMSDIVGDQVAALNQELASRSGGWTVNESGLSRFRQVLKKHSFQHVLDSMEVACDQYLCFEEGGTQATKDSVSLVLDKLSGVAHFRSLPQNDRELFYVRGILRKRFNTPADWKVIKFLRAIRDAGVPTSDLKDWARSASSWTNFYRELADEHGVHP